MADISFIMSCIDARNGIQLRTALWDLSVEKLICTLKTTNTVEALRLHLRYIIILYNIIRPKPRAQSEITTPPYNDRNQCCN